MVDIDTRVRCCTSWVNAVSLFFVLETLSRPSCSGRLQNDATFTYWPTIKIMNALKERETTMTGGTGFVGGTIGGRGQLEVACSHLPSFEDPITAVIPSGTYKDTDLPYDTKAHQQMRVRVGVLKDLSSDEADANGTLQLLDEMLVSGNTILVLRQPALHMRSQFSKIPWPCDAKTIKNT